MTLIRDALKIFKILFKVTFGEKEVKGKRRINPKILAPFLGLLIAAYIAFIVFSMVSGVAPYDSEGMVLSALLGITQIIVMFMGLFAAISFLYFSKDSQLLASLPVSSGAVFAAKMLLTYVSELALTAIIALPSLLTYGIYKAVVLGFAAVGVGYFAYTILAVFLLPFVPLLLVSVVSLPLMYIVSYLKKHSVANVVFSVLLSLVLVGGMVAFQIYINSGAAIDDAGNVNVATALSTYAVFDKVFIFNYPLRMAFIAKSAMSMLWALAYVGIVAVAGSVAILISRGLYGRVIERGFEGGSTSKEKKTNVKELVYQSMSFRKTFLLKEIRTFFNTPILLLNLIIPAVVLPVIAAVFGIVFGGAAFDTSEDPTFSPFFIVFPMFIYVSIMMVCFSNYFATIGFSREGKNFLTLKSLPVSGREITRLKMSLALVLSLVMSIDAAISMIILSVIVKIDFLTALIAVIGVFVFDVTIGIGYDMLAMANDMRKLNINWQNLTEITKKNSFVIWVQMLAMIVGLVAMIAAIILYVLLGSTLPITVVTAIIVALMAFLGAVILLFGFKKLNRDPDKWFAEVEV